MPEIFKPKSKVAVASSFEGIVNNGAPECALVSFNAYQQMPEGKGKFFGKVIEADEFSNIRNDRYVQAFLALRPDVTIAEDYGTVLQVLEGASDSEINQMLNHPDDEDSYRALRDKFDELKGQTADFRATFGSRDELAGGGKSAFYKERARLQEKDINAWMATQEPYEDAIGQFRLMIGTQEMDGNAPDAYQAVISGFVPWFATSKDVSSTYLLCKIYSQTGKLAADDIAKDGTKVCVISMDRIVGREQFPDEKNKLQLRIKQLRYVAEKEGLRHTDVWRVEDRYDPKEQQALRDEGFPIQFIVPGYIYPFDLAKAKKNPNVALLGRGNFGFDIAEYARRAQY